MVRIAARALVVAGFVGLGWAVGHAQGPAERAALAEKPAPTERAGGSDFELVVATVHGETQVRCLRGCRLTWAPMQQTASPGPVEFLAPDVKVDGVTNAQGCLAPDWWPANCHILGWKR